MSGIGKDKEPEENESQTQTVTKERRETTGEGSQSVNALVHEFEFKPAFGLSSVAYPRLSNGASAAELGGSAHYNFGASIQRPSVGWVSPETRNKTGEEDNGDHVWVKVKRSALPLLQEAGLVIEVQGKRPGETSSTPRAGPSTSTRATALQNLTSLVQSVRDLKPLGKFEKLDESRELYRNLRKYAENGSGPSQNASIKVSSIYGKVQESGNQKGKGSSSSSSSPSPYKMLLWSKTSIEGVKRIGGKRNGCVAFYDRILRAIALPLEKLGDGETLKQFILLCSVSLGKCEKSLKGYTYWKDKQMPPQGFDSVKGSGKFIPDWKDNWDHHGILVPLGKTKEDARATSSNIELMHNEYMVWEAQRVKVMFAVEVAITKSAATV